MDVAVRIALALSRYIGEWYWREGSHSPPNAARQAHFSLTEATSDEFVMVFCLIGLLCTAGFFLALGMSLGLWCLCGVRCALRGLWKVVLGGCRLLTCAVTVTQRGCRVVARWRPLRQAPRRETPLEGVVKFDTDSEPLTTMHLVVRERITRSAVVRGRAVPQDSSDKGNELCRSEVAR